MNERRQPGSVGVHPEGGRRYKHFDLTTRPLKNRRVRRKAVLLHKALAIVDAHYADTLDEAEREALHDAVLRLLRPKLRAEWSEPQAVASALDIAATLLDSLSDGE